MDEKAIIFEDSLGFLTNRAGRVMGHTLGKKFEESGLNLQLEHWIILRYLWVEDGLNQQKFSKLIFKDKGSITRAIQYLEQSNMVVRITDDQDKRKKRIYLTHKGRELEKETRGLAKQLLVDAVADIPEEEVEVCKNVLRKIYENLNK